MAPTDSTRELQDALTRLAGKPHRKARHGWMYRLQVTSSDGEACALSFGPVSDHRPRPSSATLNQVADVLRVEREKLADELARAPAEIVARLERFTAEQLKPPASMIHRAPGS